MTPEQIERLKKWAEHPTGLITFKQLASDLRALLAEWEERGRERDAFVAVLDPENRNVVSAMVAARQAEARAAEWEREAAERTREYVAVIEGLQAKVAWLEGSQLRWHDAAIKRGTEIEGLRAEVARLEGLIQDWWAEQSGGLVMEGDGWPASDALETEARRIRGEK